MNNLQKIVLTGGTFLIGTTLLAQDTTSDNSWIALGASINTLVDEPNLHFSPSLNVEIPTKSGFNFGFGAEIPFNLFNSNKVNDYVEEETITLNGKTFSTLILVGVKSKAVIEATISKAISNNNYGIGIGIDFRKIERKGGFDRYEDNKNYIAPYFEIFTQRNMFRYSLGLVSDGDNSSFKFKLQFNLQPLLDKQIEKYNIGKGGYKETIRYKLKDKKRANKKYKNKGIYQNTTNK